MSQPVRAVCILRNERGALGRIEFLQTQEGDVIQTHVSGELVGLSPGKHGFHIHEFGDTTNGCASCGGHYNPHGNPHGAPEDSTRHVGDLGNISANENGVATVDIRDKQIHLLGPNSIVGRAVVVHAGEDDLGKGGSEESLKTGNAGGRAACGVVALCAEL